MKPAVKYKKTELTNTLQEQVVALGEIKAILQAACDRDWKDETLYQTAVIAANAIYWRDREIELLRGDQRNAARWHVARQIFSHEDIERADSEMTGFTATEEENSKTDAAIDAIAVRYQEFECAPMERSNDA